MTGHTERKLLEFAAQSIGGQFHSGHISVDGGIEWDEWNPLVDDGDAFRLALSQPLIPIGLMINQALASCKTDVERRFYVRRLITEAAAAIGEKME